MRGEGEGERVKNVDHKQLTHSRLRRKREREAEVKSAKGGKLSLKARNADCLKVEREGEKKM